MKVKTEAMKGESMNLVIVESPAKAKTIEGYLGKDYVVKSSFGHVRDLPKRGLSVDLENQFKPDYQVMPDKTKVVNELKALAKKASIVWLATDEDREGEAISWHLMESLALKEEKTKRIVFHEITKPAILAAIQNPRKIDLALVNAQQARRVLDRIVGFELSPVLWRKVKPSLSAGRVQSVTVRLIVDREREIQAFESESSFRVRGQFTANGKSFSAQLTKRPGTEAAAAKVLDDINGATWHIEEVEKKPAKKSPSPPFTTSTLQQEAARKLGYSVAQTMRLAQSLYEAGKITYMRTDSVNLSQTAIDGAKAEVIKSYGEEYANPRKYATKTANAQEAHEAIRPSYFSDLKASADGQEQRLYELIWKRAIASQMADAKLMRTTIKIGSTQASEKFEVKGEIVTFDGFLRVYNESTDEDENEDEQTNLPNVSQGQEVSLTGAVAMERYTQAPGRYSEASLVRKLEELGIGRPSTYAPTISTVQKRSYVVKEDREGRKRDFKVLTLSDGKVTKRTDAETVGAERGKLFPTDVGTVVNDFLAIHFPKILDYNFTAKVEEEFDTISRGELSWTEMLGQFYTGFHSDVEKTLEHSDRATGERELGMDPASGKPVIAKIGRYGPMVQIGTVDDEEKPKFAKLKQNQSIQTLSLEEALDLFKLPRSLGEWEGKEITASVGRFGPFVKYEGKFFSLGKLNPLEVLAEEAIQVIKLKLEADSKALIREFEHNPPIRLLNGRYGPYMAVGKDNYKLPKGTEAESLSLADCLEIMSSTKPSVKSKRRK